MLNYFVYKNGQGNFFKPLTDAHSVLYVGFGHHWTRDGVQPAAIIDNTKAALPWDPDDLNHILFVSHPENRANHLLLTFEKTELRFWRATGEVRVATADEWRCASAISPRHPKDRYFGGGRVEEPPAAATDPSPFRVLPVEPVAAVPRDAIYTSVDSLASYQYLIRGTCRPLWRATGPTAAEPHPGVKGAMQDTVARCERLQNEEPFAAFVRLYLNELLHRHGRSEVRALELARLSDHAIDDTSALRIVLATMNPILVETAALAFVLDLELTPDIGVGKGKDVIDVRARASKADGTIDTDLAERVTKKLDAIAVRMGDLRLSQELRNNLMKRGVLDIQCKAADRAAEVKGVLYFGFKGKGAEGPDLLLLNDIDVLLAAGDWPNLRRFLAMQAQILLGTWPSAAAVTEG